MSRDRSSLEIPNIGKRSPNGFVATPPVRSPPTPQPMNHWYGLLARRSPWLVSASAAAMLILWLALPTSDSSVAFRWIENSVAPREIAGTLIGGHAPPSVDALMVQFSPVLAVLDDEGEP